MSEIAGKTDFSAVRYGQVWEDAAVLLHALDLRPGGTCLSIASAGDNALALLIADPAAVLAIDLNPAQLHCLDLRVAAYRTLDHGDFLDFYGARPASPRRRRQLYAACRPHLRDRQAAAFWDAGIEGLTRHGLGGVGRFERYFRLFRRWLLPLVHGRGRIAELLAGGEAAARAEFYERRWNTARWRLLFRLFFSRRVMGALGRDPAFFDYVEGSVGDHLMARTRHALVALDPADNPYLHWIVTGRFGASLPVALQAGHFETIRGRLDRLDWRCQSVEDAADDLAAAGRGVDGCNLSDIFEYMSAPATAALLGRLAALTRPGGRLVYWNMMVPRSRPDSLADRLTPLPAIAESGFTRDRAFFYRRLVVEAVAGPPG